MAFQPRQVYPTGKTEFDRRSFLSGLREAEQWCGAPDNEFVPIYPHVVAGKELFSIDGATYATVDPNNSVRVLARLPLHNLSDREDKAQLNYALSKVPAAQERWWKVPYQKRIELLEALADIIRDRQWLFIAAMAIEGGKRPFPNGFGELQEMIEFPLNNAELAKQLYTKRSPVIPKFMCDLNGIQYRSKGPIVDIEPFNFAGAIPTDKISSALVTGNAIVMKASGHTPLQGYLLYQAIQDAFDAVKLGNDGVVNFLSGHGGEMATFLLKNEHINGFTFTGSRDVFWQIQREIMTQPRTHGGMMQMIAAETSGRNAMVVCNDADLDRAVVYAVNSLINNNGQTCSHLGDLVLESAVAEEFEDKFIAALEAIKYGDIKDLGNQCGALISRENAERYENILAKMDEKGLVERVWEKRIESKSMFDFAPRIHRVPELTASYADIVHEIRSTEIFAPAVTMWTFSSLGEAKRILEASDFRLTGTVHTSDFDKMQYFIRDVRWCGQFYGLGGTTGAVVGQGFGGDALSASSSDGTGASTLQAIGKYVSMDNVALFFPSDASDIEKAQWHYELSTIMAVSPKFDPVKYIKGM